MIGQPLPNLGEYVIYTLLCFYQHVLQRIESKLNVLHHVQIESQVSMNTHVHPCSRAQTGDTGTTGAQTPLEGAQSPVWETLVGSWPEWAEAQSRMEAAGMTLNRFRICPEGKPAGRLDRLDKGV